VNYLPGLALNHDPPDFCLLSSEDCKSELLVPGVKDSYNDANNIILSMKEVYV
jgi:hypothetical protein